MKKQKQRSGPGFWEQIGKVPVFDTMTIEEAEFISYALTVCRNRERRAEEWRHVWNLAMLGLQSAMIELTAFAPSEETD